jgi:hypothetical protein
MGTILGNHLKYVQALRDRGECVLQPEVGEPTGRVEGYIKTQIPHKDAGSIFEDKDGKFGLFGDFGALHVTGICWEDLGLCDSKCWYEWMHTESMNPEYHKEKISDKYFDSSVQHAIDVRAFYVWDLAASEDVFIEEAAEVIQAVIHFRRGRCNRDVLLGEMADLQIMLDRMKIACGRDGFDKVLAAKYSALNERLDRIESGEVIP